MRSVVWKTLSSNTTKQNCHQVTLRQNQPPTMPHNMEPDTGLTRMTTRSKNATTHPGIIAQDALRVHRKKEEVEKEKELKNAQKAARRKKRVADEAREAAGRVYIARLKAEEAAAASDMEKEIPRKRPQAQAAGAKG